MSQPFPTKEKRALTQVVSYPRQRIGYIKQAAQGLFTAGTSEKKEKVGSKRGLTLRFKSTCRQARIHEPMHVPIILQA